MRKINMDTGEGIIHISNIFDEVVNVILKGTSYYIMFKKTQNGNCCGCPFMSEDECIIPISVWFKMFAGDPRHNCAAVEDAVE